MGRKEKTCSELSCADMARSHTAPRARSPGTDPAGAKACALCSDAAATKTRADAFPMKFYIFDLNVLHAKTFCFRFPRNCSGSHCMRRANALGCVLYLVCAGARAKAPFDGGTGCCPIGKFVLTNGSSTHTPAMSSLTRPPAGDMAVFEQLHVVAAHRRTAAAWFECAQLRVPAVLLHIADAECEAACKDGECRDGECNATIKKQERRLLQAIGTGTRLKIVRHSAALHLLHSTSSDIGRNATGAYADGKPLSFTEAGRIVECRPSKTTGVVYVLWNVAECDLETGRCLCKICQ